MVALLLCAGFGTRLLPLTRTLAKPAVPLARRTLIERILDWLRAQHVTDVVINLHYQPHTITSVVGDGAHLGMRVRYSWEQPILGSAGGPRHALPLIDGDPFLIVNGDTLAPVDLEPMRAAFERQRADVLMAVVPNPAPDRYNGILLDGERRVTGFVGQGDAAAGSWHFIGIQIARRSVFAPLADGVEAETVKGIYRGMVSSGRGRIFGWPVATPFFDVGTPRDYLDASVALAASEGGSTVEAGASVDASARVERTVVWPGARVEAGVTLTDCIVAGGATVASGTTAVRRIFDAGGVTWLDGAS
jgi:NDP-sugar pyrophosphorylase family protein